jgi:hypothetical protein
VIVEIAARRAQSRAGGACHIGRAASLRCSRGRRRDNGRCGKSAQQRSGKCAGHFPARRDINEFHDQLFLQIANRPRPKSKVTDVQSGQTWRMYSLVANAKVLLSRGVIYASISMKPLSR